jgi:hypothetical protein
LEDARELQGAKMASQLRRQVARQQAGQRAGHRVVTDELSEALLAEDAL